MCLILIAGCAKKKRDEDLRSLYLDGIEYLRETRIDLEKSKSVGEATIAIENSLPKLEKMVARKKEIEKENPELRDLDRREEIHAKSLEFHALRAELQSFFAFGQQLLEKYQKDERFIAAVRKGVALLQYF